MTDEEIDAMEAGREMDALIVRTVFGLEPQECMVGGHPPGCPGSIPITPYSTDIAAAWLVVEKLREPSSSGYYEVELQSEGEKDSGLWTCWFGVNHLAIGDTVPLAVCRAALKCCRNVADKKESAWEAPSDNEPNVDLP